MPSMHNEHDSPVASGRRTLAVSGPWSLDELAAVRGESKDPHSWVRRRRD